MLHSLATPIANLDWAWWVQKLAMIGSGVGAMYTIYFKLIKPLLIKRILIPAKKHLSAINTLASLADDLPTIMPKIRRVCDIVLPNHGTSISDGLGRIEAQLLQLVHNQAKNASIQDALLTDHPKPAFICSEGGNIFVNKRYAELLQCERTDLLGAGWKNFVATEDIIEHDAAWKLILSDRRDSFMTLRMRTKKSRQIILFAVQFVTLKGESGEPTNQFIGLMDLIKMD